MFRDLEPTRLQSRSGDTEITITHVRREPGSYFEAQSDIINKTPWEKIQRKTFPIIVIYQDTGLAGQIIPRGTTINAPNHRSAVRQKWRMIKQERRMLQKNPTHRPVHLIRG